METGHHLKNAQYHFLFPHKILFVHQTMQRLKSEPLCYKTFHFQQPLSILLLREILKHRFLLDCYYKRSAYYP